MRKKYGKISITLLCFTKNIAKVIMIYISSEKLKQIYIALDIYKTLLKKQNSIVKPTL